MGFTTHAHTRARTSGVRKDDVARHIRTGCAARNDGKALCGGEKKNEASRYVRKFFRSATLRFQRARRRAETRKY